MTHAHLARMYTIKSHKLRFDLKTSDYFVEHSTGKKKSIHRNETEKIFALCHFRQGHINIVKDMFMTRKKILFVPFMYILIRCFHLFSQLLKFLINLWLFAFECIFKHDGKILSHHY